MNKKKAFIENDNFDPQEAMEATVDKYKLLINRVLKEYRFTDTVNDEDLTVINEFLLKEPFGYVNVLMLNKLK